MLLLNIYSVIYTTTVKNQCLKIPLFWIYYDSCVYISKYAHQIIF